MPFYLAFKELRRARGRYILFSLVIALITLLVLFVAALAEGLGSGNREYIEKLNADLLVYQANVDLNVGASRIGAARLNEVRRVPGVKAVGPIATSNGSVMLEGGRKLVDRLVFFQKFLHELGFEFRAVSLSHVRHST